ncbi:MAG: PKD domain-containing protein [Vicingaceae bacterium]
MKTYVLVLLGFAAQLSVFAESKDNDLRGNYFKMMPTADAGSDKTICANESTPIGGNPTGPVGATYQWSNGASLTSTTVANPVASPAVTTTYSVTVTDGANNTATDQVTVTVNTLPFVNAGPDRTICFGDSFQLGGSPTTTINNPTYKWSSPGTLDDDTIANPMATPTITTTYRVTVTDQNGCTNSDQIRITLTGLPPVNAGSNKTICAGESVRIGGNPTGPIFSRYAWSNGATLDDTSISNPTANPLKTTTYTVTVTPFGFNPCTNTDQVTVVVDSLPVVNAGRDTTICDGSSVVVGGNPTSPNSNVTYKWNGRFSMNSITIANPTATPSSSRTYTLTVTDNTSSCSATDQIRVSVDTIPLADAGADRSICLGTSTNLGTNASGATYTWNSSSTLSDTSIANPTATPLTTTTYSLTVSSGVNCTATDQVTVTVDTLPFADAGADLGICAGSSIGIGGSPTGPAGASFQWDNAATLSNANSANPTASPTVTTTYNVTVTEGASSCTSTDQMTVTVDPFPLADAGTDQSICDGASIQLGASPSAATGNTVAWTPTTGLSSTTAFNPTATPNVTTTYTLSVTDAISGCTNTDEITITVDTIPIADAGVDVSICEKDSISIGNSNTIGLKYLWNNASSLTNDTISNPNAFPSTTTSYALTVTNTFGCTAEDLVQVDVNPLPVVNAGNDKSICIGDTVLIGGNPTGIGTGLTYLWNNVNLLSDESAANPLAFPLDTQEFSVEVTDQFACVAKDTIQLNVNPLPQVAFTATALCEGALTFFTDNSSISQGSLLNWRWDFGDGIGTSFSQNPDYSFSSPGTYTVKLRVTSQVGCLDSTEQSITINPQPTADAGIDKEICQGDVVQLGGSPTSEPGSSYSWSPNSSLNNSTLANPSASPLVTTEYTLTVTDQLGCSNFDTVVVKVNSLPAVNVSASNQSVCVDEAVQLSATGATNYEWSPNLYLDNAFAQNPQANPLKNVQYVVAGTDANGCVGKDSVLLEVFNVDFNSIDTAICFGTSVQLKPVIEGDESGISYNWTPDENLSNNAVRNPISSTRKEQTYYLEVENAFGCIDRDSIVVKIRPRAGLDFEYHITPLCLGAIVDLINNTTNSNQFEWRLNNELFSTERAPSFEIDNTLENEIQLVGFASGCADTLKNIIPVADFVKRLLLETPNVFTPNGDGVNDLFDPAHKFKGKPLGCIDFGGFQIFNRWGKLVFETKLEDKSWDGSTEDGKPAKEGTYFFVVEVEDKELKGTVYLSR